MLEVVVVDKGDLSCFNDSGRAYDGSRSAREYEGRYGILIANLEHRNRVRYVNPAKETIGLISAYAPGIRERWYEQEACPLKKLLKPSSKVSLFFGLQIVDDTMTRPLKIFCPTPPTVCVATDSELRSGLHRFRKSGRGFPVRFLTPSVKKKAEARASPSPIHPVFHSQSLIPKVLDLGVPFCIVGPGTKITDTNKIIIAGATRLIMTNTGVDILSSVKGYEISKSCGEKGR